MLVIHESGHSMIAESDALVQNDSAPGSPTVDMLYCDVEWDEFAHIGTQSFDWPEPFLDRGQ